MNDWLGEVMGKLMDKGRDRLKVGVTDEYRGGLIGGGQRSDEGIGGRADG